MSERKQRLFHNNMQVVIWLVSLLPVILAAAVYKRLPDQIPTNWGFDGHISYGGKLQIWFIAGMSPFLAGLFYVLPDIDPKRRNYRKFSGAYQSFQLFMQVFLLVILCIILVESFWPGTVQVSAVVMAMCSLLFILLGNMMPKFRQNFFCGFRTPWALSDETVWNKTHRLGGKLMFGAGILGFMGAFLPGEKLKMAMLLVPLAAATIIPYIMSYVWFKNRQGGEA
ncbi:MAG: DUF1648 domain-containing protein [Hungatella sp.]|nr:DUF1648 domain-containing protein [Hungatella sp.]